MTNEELAALIQAGDRDRLTELWEQVRRLVMKYAHKWAGVGGMGLDDLEQCGFIAVMEAADTYDRTKGLLTTWLDFYIKGEFSIACSQRTEKQRREPLLTALSIDAPLTDDTGDPFTLADILEDPAASAAMESVDERDQQDRLRAAVEEAIAALTPDQQEAVRGRYWRGEVVSSQNINKALARLRHPSLGKRLWEYR